MSKTKKLGKAGKTLGLGFGLIDLYLAAGLIVFAVASEDSDVLKVLALVTLVAIVLLNLKRLATLLPKK